MYAFHVQNGRYIYQITSDRLNINLIYQKQKKGEEDWPHIIASNIILVSHNARNMDQKRQNQASSFSASCL